MSELITKYFEFGSGSFKEWFEANSDVEHLITTGTISGADNDAMLKLDILGDDYNIQIFDMGRSHFEPLEWGYSPLSQSVCESIIFPQSIVYMHPDFEFYGFLKSVVFPDSIIEIGGCSFCRNYIESVVLPPKLKSLGFKAFGDNPLKRVDIPNSCIEVEGGAFSGCWELSEIMVDDSHPTYKTVNRSLYSKDGRMLVCPAGTIVDFVIEDGTEDMCDGVFWNSQLKSIRFPCSFKKFDLRYFSNMYLDGSYYLRDIYIECAQGCTLPADMSVEFESRDVYIHFITQNR